MKNLLLKTAFLAASVLGLLASTDLHAVYLDAGGKGQALIYPYYTTRAVPGGSFNTYITVVGAATPKVVRVRFREGRNGREVLSFNLYLAARDTWAGAVIPQGTGVRLVTRDQSCTNPPYSTDAAQGVSYFDFSSTSFTGVFADGLGTDAGRLAEGYVEMIEMATLTGGSAANASFPSGSGVPGPFVNCPALQGPTVAIETAAPTGGLSGTLTVINVANGLNFTVNADALAQLTTLPFYRPYIDSYPDFDSAEVNPVGHFVANGKAYRLTFVSGIDAVSAALLKTTGENEWLREAGTNTATDWVLTMPMRRFIHTSSDAFVIPTSFPQANAGYAVGMDWASRDGPRFQMPYGCPSICPAGSNGSGLRLPWATTVWSFTRSGDGTIPSAVFGSANAQSFALFQNLGESGSAIMDLDPLLTVHSGVQFQATSVRLSDGTIASESGFLLGIPAVGFMARTFQNGQLACGSATCQGNYGGAYPHKWSLGTAAGMNR